MKMSMGLGLNHGGGGGGGGASGTRVFPLLGQSNMVGTVADDGNSGYPAGTLQYGAAGLVPAVGALDHIGSVAPLPTGLPCIALGFAQRYAAANPGATIVFVPCADGGSGFDNNKWNPGDALYEAARARINACMSENPSFILEAFLWHQGESDGNRSASATYQAALTAMVDPLRDGDILAADIHTPFVLGDLLPSYNLNEVPQVKAIINDAPNFLDRAGVAPSTGTTGHDNKHFDGPSLRAMGDRYMGAYLAALADLPAAPAQVTGLAAVASPGEVALTWNAAAGATSYRLSRSTTPGGPYSVIATTTSATAYTDADVINGTTYHYIAEAVNVGGAGAASAEVSATPDVISALAVVSTAHVYSDEGSAQGTSKTCPGAVTVDGAPYVLVVHSSRTNGVTIPSTVTLNGVAATYLADATDATIGSVAYYLVSAASGTGGDILLTFPAPGTSFVGVGVVRLNAIPALDGSAGSIDLDASATTDLVLDVSAGGLILAGHSSRGGGTGDVPFSYDFAAGASGVADYALRPQSSARQSLGSQAYASAVVGETVTVNGSTSIVAGAACAMSLRLA